MKVGYFVAGVSSKASGLATAVTGWANAVSKYTPSQVNLFTVQCGNRGFSDFEVVPPADLIREPGAWFFRLNYSSALKKRVIANKDKIELFHNHCIWTLPTHYSHSAATQFERPLMITPHGALNSVALNRSKWKKAIIRWLFQSKVLRGAKLFHAFTRQEAESIRKTGLKQPIAILPNGVDLPEDTSANENSFLDAFPSLKEKKIILFLARLHPIKGIDYLIDAWHQIESQFPDWQLVLAGPDGGKLEWIQSEVSERNIAERVTLTGSVFGQQKDDAFRASDCFILPSYSEGFSMTILEALAHRRPVIISDQCNFDEVAKRDAGLICETNTTSLRSIFHQMLSATENERKLMGENGRKMIEQEYTWSQVASKMHKIYAWQCGDQRPNDVEVV